MPLLPAVMLASSSSSSSSSLSSKSSTSRSVSSSSSSCTCPLPGRAGTSVNLRCPDTEDTRSGPSATPPAPPSVLSPTPLSSSSPLCPAASQAGEVAVWVRTPGPCSLTRAQPGIVLNNTSCCGWPFTAAPSRSSFPHPHPHSKPSGWPAHLQKRKLRLGEERETQSCKGQAWGWSGEGSLAGGTLQRCGGLCEPRTTPIHLPLALDTSLTPPFPQACLAPRLRVPGGPHGP